MKKEQKLSFEEAMDNLESIVDKLENGELSLDESMDYFKKGIELSNQCSSMLDEAEKSITILLKDKNGEVCDSHISVNYAGAQTDNGTVYEEFGYYHVKASKEDPDSVGITVFTMKDPDTGNWITVGGE